LLQAPVVERDGQAVEPARRVPLRRIRLEFTEREPPLVLLQNRTAQFAGPPRLSVFVAAHRPCQMRRARQTELRARRLCSADNAAPHFLHCSAFKGPSGLSAPLNALFNPHLRHCAAHNSTYVREQQQGLR
jgi:hypothetical protein